MFWGVILPDSLLPVIEVFLVWLVVVSDPVPRDDGTSISGSLIVGILVKDIRVCDLKRMKGLN